MDQEEEKFTSPSLHISPIVIPAFMAAQACTGSHC